jgi:hypothetical protein
MTIRQISVFLENKAGHLNKILAVLAQNNININALTVADSSDYGLLRMLVSDPEKAVEILRSENFPVRIHEVISLEMSAAPGSMSQIIDLFFDLENTEHEKEIDTSIRHFNSIWFGGNGEHSQRQKILLHKLLIKSF